MPCARPALLRKTVFLWLVLTRPSAAALLLCQLASAAWGEQEWGVLGGEDGERRDLLGRSSRLGFDSEGRGSCGQALSWGGAALAVVPKGPLAHNCENCLRLSHSIRNDLPHEAP